MPTIWSSWQGTGGKARIRVEYTRTYNSARTRCTFDGKFFVEFGGKVVDSTNIYETDGDCGVQSGTKNYDFGSAGGEKQLGNGWSVTLGRDANVKAWINNVADVGNVRILGDFGLGTGGLNPSVDNTAFAYNVQARQADIWSIAGDGNGLALDGSQVQYNTSPTDAGSQYATTGAYVWSLTLTGLAPNTTYYFRERVKNAYGWSYFGGWKSFTTPASVPGTPSFGVAAPSQDSTYLTGLGVDTGGVPITRWDVQYNTAQTETGAVTQNVGEMYNLVPGTTYYVRVRATNSVGTGAWSGWVGFTTLPSAYINVGGGWRAATVYVKVGGVWKPASCYVKVNGNWKR